MGTIAQTVSKGLGVLSSVTGGIAQDRASRFQAKQLKQQSQAIEAQGMRQAEQARKKGDVLATDAIAAQVSGGGSASDPQAIRQQAKLKDRGEFAALASIFESGEMARGKRLQAKSKRLEGKIAKQQGILEGVGKGIDWASSEGWI